MTPEARLTPLLVVLLALWCGVGLKTGLDWLRSPVHGWRVSRPAETRGSVGVPLVGADEVTHVRALLRGAAAGAELPWLVVLPPDVDGEVLQYVRAQLAHLEYPRRVDVVPAGRQPPLAGYHGVITHPRVAMRGLGRPWRVVEGFSAFVEGRS